MKKSIKKVTIRELNLADDFLFAKVMSDPNICRKVLENILNVSIKGVTIPTTQRTIDLLLEGKGIRLDVYVNDEKGTIYNVEMQRGRKRELPKRSRYYQGSIDLDLISSGDSYTNLKKTFIIFICTFDPFAEGRHLYTFKNICTQSKKLILGDETEKIFLNTRGTRNDVSQELNEFLTYIEDTTDRYVLKTNNRLIQEIHKKVVEIKESKELEVEYMTLYQRDQENIELGRQQGREEGICALVLDNMEEGISDTRIVEKLQLRFQLDSKTAVKYLEKYKRR